MTEIVWTYVITRLLERIRNLRDCTADPASEVERTDLGKRQSRFEHDVHRLLVTVAGDFPTVLRVEVEGYKHFGPADAPWVLCVDPVDGTAGDARLNGIGGLSTGLPVSTVVAIRRNVQNPTFADVHYAGILELGIGRIFVAGPEGAFYGSERGLQPLVRRPQYNVHSPAIATEIARRSNAFLRFLVPYGVYPEQFADSHSSAIVMLWSLLGYCDMYWNAELPGIKGSGQRGHELGAVAVFARALGACAFTTVTYELQVIIAMPLDYAPYTFDGQTSVVMGVDEAIVKHYLGLVNASLRRYVTLRDGIGSPIEECSVGKMLALLHQAVPNERWDLPLIPPTQ